MEKTQIADYIGKPDNAYALLAFLSDDTKHAVGSLLADLKQKIGDGLWTMPKEALHITLCEIIQPKPYIQDKQSLYEANETAYENTPGKILAKFKPINIRFNKIIASPQAITIQGQDDGSFNNIRQQLVDHLPMPGETKLPPDIVHCSIARFTQELDIEKVRQIVARYSINYMETIEEFKLVNNLAPPLLQYKVIRRYSLVK